MLLTLILWAALLAACVAAGATVLRLIGASLPDVETEEQWLALVWLGLVVLASALLAISFWTPLTAQVSGSLLVLLAVGAAATRPALPPAPHLRLAAGVTALALVMNIGPIRLYDTGLYHQQQVQWLQQAGTAPGIAIFHYRLGFSSAWTALVAAVDSGPWQGRAGAVANGFVAAVLLMHLGLALRRWVRGAAASRDYLILGGLPMFAIAVVQHMHVSESSNFAAAALTLAVAWLWMSGARKLVTMLALGAVSLKLHLAALPLLLVGWHPRAVVLGLAVAAPVFFANLISTGCPLFPSSIACLDTPWSVGAVTARVVSQETIQWARYLGPFPPDAPYLAVDWVWGWLRLPWNALLAVLVAVALWRLGRNGGDRRLAAAALLCIGCVLATAPDFRFMFGAAGALAGTVVATWGPKPFLSFRNAVALIAVLLVLETTARQASYAFLLNVEAAKPSLSTLAAPSRIQAAPVRRAQVNDVAYWIPSQQQCWSAPLPCWTQHPPSSLHLCDPRRGLRAGLCR